MTRRNCDCKNISIVEGTFGEIFADQEKNDLQGAESTGTISSGEGDASKVKNELIKIKSYTLTNKNRMEVVLITWGATIVSIKCPDKYGDVADVVLGFDDLQSYLDPTLNEFMGCILGRCANRIRDGTFKIKNTEYFLTKNDANKHHLHGGTNGFGRRVWDAHVEKNCYVVMSYLSEDGEEGYPGAVMTTIKFTLTNDNRLEINMRASTTKPTVVNLSHGSFFNLAGHDSGENELMMHKVSLNCDRWTFAEFVDPIPTGAIRGVNGTIMDLRIPKRLINVIQKVPPGNGYDHNYGVIRCSQPAVSFVSRALHENSGRFLEIYSDQPGVQFYTGGRLPPYSLPEDSKTSSEIRIEGSQNEIYECVKPCDCVTQSSESRISIQKTLDYLPGKGGAQYKKFGAFSIQPQNYPDSINISHFPCAVLHPGQVYYHDLVYKFGIQLGGYMTTYEPY